MEQVCFSTTESIAGIVGVAITIASTVVNFVPAPDKISNPGMKLLSRFLHFVALDLVTAKK